MHDYINLYAKYFLLIPSVLLYNSGGGIGDSIQILPLIDTLKSNFINTKFYYLSAHENHFNSSLNHYKTNIQTLNLEVKYFGIDPRTKKEKGSRKALLERPQRKD